MSINERVRKTIIEILELDSEDQLKDDVPFTQIENAEVDSIAALDVLTALEKEFRIRITEKYLTRLGSVNQIVDTVNEILAEKELITA
jgi:acyl carrier protein